MSNVRAALGLSSEEVARAVGWNPASVRRVQAAYLKEGVAALCTVGRGGRRHENLSLEEEKALLVEFGPARRWRGDSGGQ